MLHLKDALNKIAGLGDRYQAFVGSYSPLIYWNNIFILSPQFLVVLAPVIYLAPHDEHQL